MEKDRKRIFDGFCSVADQGMLDDIRTYLSTDDGIGDYQVEIDSERNIVIKMLLKKFSYLSAKNCFLSLSEYMRRSYYNVFECEECEEQVQYIFCTGISGRDGIKCEVTIR